MAIPILHIWQNYYENPDEGLGSSYERVILNRLLLNLTHLFPIQSVLEVPSFGFTGMSGINSMELARNNVKTTVADNNIERTDLIRKTWESLSIDGTIDFLPDFSCLPYPNQSFDMVWNFSALWFVENLTLFLSELDRVSKKIILLCVPNQTGIGYMNQKRTGKEDIKKYLNEEYINPKTFTPFLNALGWHLLQDNFIDCPPWPDIGMPKEDFLRKMGINIPKKLSKTTNSSPMTILDYYSNKDPLFESKMMKYFWFEKSAPRAIKKHWAHHHYYLFTRTSL